MKRWLSALVLTFAFAGGILGGTPLYSANTGEMMDCCDKAMSGEMSLAADAARLCCILQCPEPGSTPSSARTNTTQTFSTTETPVLAIFLDTRSKELPRVSYAPAHTGKLVRSERAPKYLKHNSFLI